MPWVAFAVGVVSIVLCTWLRFRFTRTAADVRARAALVRSAKPYAEAKSGELARVVGIAHASDQGLVEGPMSKTSGIWLKIEVTEDRGDESFSPLATVVESRPCLVEGARIGAAFQPVEVSKSMALRRTSSGPVVEASPAVVEFLARHGRRLDSKDGFARRREYTEILLEAGAHVLVVGRRGAARVEAQPSGYRDGTLVVADEITPELFALGTEADVLRAARRTFGIADALMIGFLFVMVFPMLGWLVFGILSLMGFNDANPTSD